MGYIFQTLARQAGTGPPIAWWGGWASGRCSPAGDVPLQHAEQVVEVCRAQPGERPDEVAEQQRRLAPLRVDADDRTLPASKGVISASRIPVNNPTLDGARLPPPHP